MDSAFKVKGITELKGEEKKRHSDRQTDRRRQKMVTLTNDGRGNADVLS